jgi:purine-binding chemotaxis protein CheW
LHAYVGDRTDRRAIHSHYQKFTTRRQASGFPLILDKHCDPSDVGNKWSVRMVPGEDDVRYLLCRVGSRIAALDVRDVWETMRPLPIEPLAGAPAFVLGLAIVRGFPIPVVDADRLLGSSGSSSTPLISPSPARFISLKLGVRSAVLSVDAVLEIRALPTGMLANIQPLLGEAGADLVSVIGTLDAKLLLVLEAARLVPDSVWDAINFSKGSA